MASNPEAQLKKIERTVFLQKALNLDEIYRQALARVQFMKTRYKKAFEPDEDEYTYYIRAKRAVSKLEYSQRKMDDMDAAKALAKATADAEGFKKADAEYERYMKNMLYYAYGIGQLYTSFVERAPNGSL